jgi:hypothetical protein
MVGDENLDSIGYQRGVFIKPKKIKNEKSRDEEIVSQLRLQNRILI